MLLLLRDDRLCKKVVEEQKRMAYENCWYSELERVAKKLMINLEDVNTLKKSQWKKTIKDKIQEFVEKESEEKIQSMRKLRHQKGQKFTRQKYLTEYGIAEASEIMKTKLEMWDLGKNMGNARKCICEVEEETTEHVIECGVVREKLKRDKTGMRISGETQDLRKITELIKSYIEYREKEQ